MPKKTTKRKPKKRKKTIKKPIRKSFDIPQIPPTASESFDFLLMSIMHDGTFYLFWLIVAAIVYVYVTHTPQEVNNILKIAVNCLEKNS